MEKDKARAKTDKKLESMEKGIGSVYRENHALFLAKKAYAAYMAKVQKRTEGAYSAFKHAGAEDDADALKKAYMDELKALTLNSDEYRKIVEQLADALAQANQQAVGIVNAAMIETYVDNYNQAAEECRRVGIKVDGEE